MLLEAAGGRLILVQSDLIGVQGRLFERVVEHVRTATGEDVAGSLILAANHTHSGPGHVFRAVISDVVTDAYDEVVADNVARAIATAVSEALTAEAVDVTASVATTQSAALHSDRRCENPEYTNDTMTLLRLDTEDGKPLALVMNYAMHPTVFSPEDGMLSGDAARAVELGVEEALADDTAVLFFQSWAGDMAPGHPKHHYASSPHGAGIGGLDRLESLGREAAEVVLAAEGTYRPLDPTLTVTTALLPIDHGKLGYDGDEFPVHGAILCGFGAPACDTEADMSACLSLNEGEAPDRVRLTAARLGDLAVVTLPGEPLTTLGEHLVDTLTNGTDGAAADGADGGDGPRDVLLLGYAQDYLGYLLLPADWYAGGYEGSFNFWGPNQALYFADSAVALASTLFDEEATLPFTPVEPLPWDSGPTIDYSPASSPEAPTILEDLPATAKVGDDLTLTWTGGDPWFDSPNVTLERLVADGSRAGADRDGDGAERDANGNTWTAARAGGRLVSDEGYRITLTMTPSPGWDEDADTRTFAWTAHLRTAIASGGPLPALVGTWRLRVWGRGMTSPGEIVPYLLESTAVTIESDESARP